VYIPLTCFSRSDWLTALGSVEVVTEPLQPVIASSRTARAAYFVLGSPPGIEPVL